MSLSKLHRTIQKHKRFLLSTHVNPDPDALCSIIALCMYLKHKKKQVTMIVNDPVPKRFEFLPGVKSIKSYSQIKKINYDVAIICDCGDIDRIERVKNLIDKNHLVINIDHHITNTMFGNLNYVKPDASSTAEVLYDILKSGRMKFSKALAMNLYAGIMTDTGSFRYENTTSKTHAIVSDLMRFKVDAYGIYKRFYESIPMSDQISYIKVMNKLNTSHKGKIATVLLSKKLQKKFTKEFDLRDVIFRFLRSTKGVEVCAIFTEVNKKATRVNLRSTGGFNVAKLAHRFSGGGHRQASGCMVEAGMLSAKKRITAAIVKEL